MHGGAVKLDTQVLKRLSENAPEAGMVRAILEHSLQVDAVDKVFERSCQTQYTRTLLFSSVVSLMVSVESVATSVRPFNFIAISLRSL